VNYGFVIDNRKCIGCHACTVACKAEHDVPIGVNRTWVKYVEKGEYPNTQRLFSVMRCNHCADAPCVTICPTQALFTRKDGIVDFDGRRCIGCKACTQACPYDAIYIDPDTHTAAKCNYCAHRVDVGLEPACVIVCPEHAIVSGDLDDPSSEIAQLIATQEVTARKIEKKTEPKLFYIEGDVVSLNPTLAPPSADYATSGQSAGVGHFARFAEQRIATGTWMRDSKTDESAWVPDQGAHPRSRGKAIDVLKERARRVYDAPAKGVVWGWSVAAYVWTKAIAAGSFLVVSLPAALDITPVSVSMQWWALGTAFVFLSLTGALLVKDLDRPERFLYVLLRPNWQSWLVRGGYAVLVYGFMLSALTLAMVLDWSLVRWIALAGAALSGVVVAIYTAFLFAQGKGRDFWQSSIMPWHMLAQSIVAGAAVGLLLTWVGSASGSWIRFLQVSLQIAIIADLFLVILEVFSAQATDDAARVARAIVRGPFRNTFWIGVIVVGHLLPLLVLWIPAEGLWPFAGVFAAIGLYLVDHIWVRAPQLVPLS
jgi:Fe-S-cluster-containing dehydrogenase component/formate-dependent nitrite reductase membrane component NrfD